MFKMPWISRKDHDRIVRTNEAVIAVQRTALGTARENFEKAKQERDDARTALAGIQHQLAAVTAELAPLKAARERANANLAAANARRKAVANDAPLPPAA